MEENALPERRKCPAKLPYQSKRPLRLHPALWNDVPSHSQFSPVQKLPPSWNHAYPHIGLRKEGVAIRTSGCRDLPTTMTAPRVPIMEHPACSRWAIAGWMELKIPKAGWSARL